MNSVYNVYNSTITADAFNICFQHFSPAFLLNFVLLPAEWSDRPCLHYLSHSNDFVPCWPPGLHYLGHAQTDTHSHPHRQLDKSRLTWIPVAWVLVRNDTCHCPSQAALMRGMPVQLLTRSCVCVCGGGCLCVHAWVSTSHWICGCAWDYELLWHICPLVCSICVKGPTVWKS